MTEGPTIVLGSQVLGSLDEGARREWLVADGLGGYAMGTASGLRTRRYHGLLTVATRPPAARFLALAALDPVLVVGDARIRLATHEWNDGSIDPRGHTLLSMFALEDGLPRWRWQVGDVVLDRTLAMVWGGPAVGILHRLVHSGVGSAVRLELSALCTWREAGGERKAGGSPSVGHRDDGFAFEGHYQVRGDDGAAWDAGGEWYRGVRHRVEAERGLPDSEDVWWAGTFSKELRPGDEMGIRAWGGEQPPPGGATDWITAARDRAQVVVSRAQAADDVDSFLALAADQFVVKGEDAPSVVAGYPWFGEWTRDSMVSYEGLFLETGRPGAGRDVLRALAARISEGILPNTADAGEVEDNSADGTLWFLHALGRHVERVGDLDLAREVLPALEEVVRCHVDGTRHGIRVDPGDGLLAQGEPGLALTWMDARVEGRPITPRQGKPVELNGLWVRGMAVVADLKERLRVDASAERDLGAKASSSFNRRFVTAEGVLDVVDGPEGDDPTVRPNALIAAGLPWSPLRADVARRVVEASGLLLTPLGLRSLAPDHADYRGRHRGGPAERDAAYHQGTVWPWLMGAYVDAGLRSGVDVAACLRGLEAHLGEWGLGSVSETAEGDAPHVATGCPFQAWSVAELLRARRLVRDA